jgi:Thiolase, C-terminal domain
MTTRDLTEIPLETLGAFGREGAHRRVFVREVRPEDSERLRDVLSLAIALGHPIGATGVILVVKALHELERTGGRYALVTLGIGGDMGIVAVFENLQN